MTVPASRRSSSRKRRAHAHLALKKVYAVKCTNCGKQTKPHQVCPSCGYYKGKQVVKAKTKKNKTR